MSHMHHTASFLSNNKYEFESTQSSIVLEQLRDVEDLRESRVDYEKCTVLLCAKCSTVMADSLGVCGEAKNITSVICLKVTKDVRVKEKYEVCMDGPLAFCTYKGLECGGCHRFVGVVLHSTPPHLSSLRNLFLLRKEVLNCYKLKNSTIVKASNITFETRPLRSSITELTQELEAQLKKMDVLKGMLENTNISSEDRGNIRPRASNLPHSTTLQTSVSE